jgi:hypothetical protein
MVKLLLLVGANQSNDLVTKLLKFVTSLNKVQIHCFENLFCTPSKEFYNVIMLIPIKVYLRSEIIKNVKFDN